MCSVVIRSWLSSLVISSLSVIVMNPFMSSFVISCIWFISSGLSLVVFLIFFISHLLIHSVPFLNFCASLLALFIILNRYL